MTVKTAEPGGAASKEALGKDEGDVFLFIFTSKLILESIPDTKAEGSKGYWFAKRCQYSNYVRCVAFERKMLDP